MDLPRIDIAVGNGLLGYSTIKGLEKYARAKIRSGKLQIKIKAKFPLRCTLQPVHTDYLNEKNAKHLRVGFCISPRSVIFFLISTSFCPEKTNFN